jgi:3-methyladenine DNA glycosylase AlkD
MNRDEVLSWLERRGSRRNIDGMARYGIVARRAFGVPMAKLLQLKKQLGVDQQLSLGLWQTGCYEARLLAALLGDPQQVTRRQMDAWARSFENWGDCDTACFHLFDKTPHALAKVPQWAKSKQEFVQRGAFALLACVALHDKVAADAAFAELLPVVERAAGDERNFVMKGVSWALRAIGRRNGKLRAAAVAVAKRLAKSDEAPRRWVGKDVLRDLGRVKGKA